VEQLRLWGDTQVKIRLHGSFSSRFYYMLVGVLYTLVLFNLFRYGAPLKMF